MDYKRFFTFGFTFLILQFISCTLILKNYMDGVNKISKKKFNLSNYPNYLINLLMWLFGYWIIVFMFYSLFYKYNKSIIILSLFGIIMWALWDLFPITIVQDGYKYSLAYIYDIFITGGFCIGLTVYLYKNYYSVLSKNIYILAILYILSYCIFFYEGFIYNREGTENNWLVKLGDSLNLHKMLPYIRLNL